MKRGGRSGRAGLETLRIGMQNLFHDLGITAAEP
jgi:hypothetical protein